MSLWSWKPLVRSMKAKVVHWLEDLMSSLLLSVMSQARSRRSHIWPRTPRRPQELAGQRFQHTVDAAASIDMLDDLDAAGISVIENVCRGNAVLLHYQSTLVLKLHGNVASFILFWLHLNVAMDEHHTYLASVHIILNLHVPKRASNRSLCRYGSQRA